MKTILHVCKYYHPYLGGIETVAKYLAEGLTDYQNIVICFSTDGNYHEEVINKVRVYRAPVNFSFMSQDVSFRYYWILKKLVIQYAPYAIHVHCPNPFVYPLVEMVADDVTKVVLHWHSDILSKGIIYSFIKHFENRILDRANVIISTSPNYISHSVPLMKHRDKVKVVQNGIILSNFILRSGEAERVEEIRRSFSGKKIVYFVGRHVPYKGIDCLIRADKYITSDCVILIAGSGPQDDYLQSIECSERIRFVGRLSDTELRLYSHAADVFAFPSINKAEAFGVALAEAMFCRSVPVTYTIEGSGVNWVSIGGETGEEVELSNVKAFAAAVDKILQDDRLREQYAEKAYQRIVQNFTSEVAAKVMGDIYREM